MEWPPKAAILLVIATFEASEFDFDQFMSQLAAVIGTECASKKMPDSVRRAWSALDDSYAIACSQTWSRPIQLELNHELRAEYESFKYVVQNPAVH